VESGFITTSDSLNRFASFVKGISGTRFGGFLFVPQGHFLAQPSAEAHSTLQGAATGREADIKNPKFLDRREWSASDPKRPFGNPLFPITPCTVSVPRPSAALISSHDREDYAPPL
jgi:hypothetical protein